MQDFDFYRAKTVKEALEILKHEQEKVKLVSGGTDLLIDLRSNSIPKQVRLLLDISGLEELKQIELQDGRLRIGGAVALADIATAPAVREHAVMLHSAADAVGSQQIRNRGTLSGNIVTAAQCADTVPALMVLDAELLLKSASGSRSMGITEFFTGPKQTSISPAELLTEIIINPPGKEYRGVFEKLMRREAVAKSRLGLAVLARQNGNGVVEDLRLSIGSSLPTHGRFPTVEKLLCGKRVDGELLREAAEEAGQYMLRSGGRRWSTDYKLPVVRNLTEKCLRAVLEV
ncbi:MAG: FAD binding domain-containing protein [Spirochaetia bacterium]